MRNLILPITFLFVVLVSSCNDEQDSFSLALKEANETVIDEQRQTLLSPPMLTMLVNDSLIAAYFMDKMVVHVYNIYTGKLAASTAAFRKEIDFDSLMTGAMKKAELDSMEILPSSPADDEIAEGPGLQSFTVIDGNLYFFYSIPFRYKPKTASGRQAILERMPAVLREQYKDNDEEVTGDIFKCYLVETDAHLRLKKITEVQCTQLPSSARGQYQIMPGGGFYAGKGKLFTRCYDDMKFMMMPPPKKIKNSDSLPLLGMMGLSGEKYRWEREILNTSVMDGYSFHSSYYAIATLGFKEIKDTLLVSCEGGIYSLPDGKKFRLQKKLDPGEVSIGTFDLYDGRLLYTAGKQSPKGYMTPDSLKLCIYNPRTNRVEHRQSTPSVSFAMKQDTLLYFDKNKEHYVIKRFAIIRK